MTRRSTLLAPFLFLMVLGCAESDSVEGGAGTVDLVPVEEITRLLPTSVDSFRAEGDTTYRGYMPVTPRGSFAVSTTARIYATPSGDRISINLSSFDNKPMFLAAYGADATRDSTVDNEAYDVLLGRVVLASDNHAVEARGFDSLAVRRAIDLVDIEALAALERVPMEVDSTFLRRETSGSE